jgi:tRNA (guanosine-2'-O-)-methyltransferase
MLSAHEQNQLLINHFSQFISEHKREFIDRVLDQRTRYITIALEDIYQSQNASAVIRTCECLGLQDIHIVENSSQWTTNKQVLKGSNKWLDIIRYRKKNFNNTEDCFNHLRQRGYQIAVTDPSPDGLSIEDIELDKPLAIVMGNERHGSTRYALDHADMKVNIPMVGFTESLNISVSAAICLNALLSRLRKTGLPWGLPEADKEALKLQWYKKVVRRAELVEREFLRSIN